MTKRTIFLAVAAVGLWVAAEAQTVLTLEQCLQTGIERNLGLARRQNQMVRSREAVSESRANLLPQINGYFNLNDNFEPTTNVGYSPAAGAFVVSEALQYNAAGGVQLSMPLYNQSLYTAVAVKRLLADIDRMQYDKAREDLIVQISRLYYLGQMTAEQIRLIEENIGRISQLRDITQALHENDVVLEVDVQRIDINLKNLRVSHQNALSLHKQQLNTLKYIIDYDSSADIALTAIDVSSEPAVALTGVTASMPELEMLRGQQTLAQRQMTLVKQGYLPTLSLTGQLAWNTFSDKMSGWLDGASTHNKWYNTYGIGVSLRVPIFDGLSKKYRLRQAKIDAENARITLEDTQKSLQREYVNAVDELTNNRRTYEEQLENLKLARRVYDVTVDRYKEGLAGMTEVLQDEMSINAAQNAYVSAHYNYRATSLTLLKLTGNLETLLK